MDVLQQLALLLRITRSQGIVRRYFVVNGFDGALTMLGLTTGFYVSGSADLRLAINACLAASIALGMSGIISAYVSEAAEKRKELQELEKAMVTDLGESAYGQAARLLPFVIAAVNGLAPFCIALLILLPLFIAHWRPDFLAVPLETAMAVALGLIFLLGVFLGRISGTFWLWAGVRTLLMAAVTVGLIMLITPG